ncbi:hypothetical protein G7071_08175 [Nocardioides piscis]|uniref:P/Homo B domain-containing protein n=2 Tax=Nocardioides piscis TaxID=2714938 RepID=A0A6G7YKR2_9ACTN|nr:hypothetical protein G7071_08175 [Nocardioides piscis]
MASGTLDGAYTFDDEAGAKISGANPVPGRFRPATPAAGLEGSTGTGKWSLWLLNDSTSGGILRSFTVTLTYATCDSDGDGVEESADNCPTLANDQADIDGDSVGDACDVNDDGDALPDATDGCPATASGTGSGCPAATRSAAVTHLAKKKRVVLATRSLVAACRPGAEMTFWRKRRGKDLRVVVASTNSSGKIRLRSPKKAGRYYATVAASYVPGAAECGSARSKTIRIRHRR